MPLRGSRESFVLVLFFVLRPSSSTSGASAPPNSERAQSARSTVSTHRPGISRGALKSATHGNIYLVGFRWTSPSSVGSSFCPHGMGIVGLFEW